jgi:hypothetical protein
MHEREIVIDVFLMGPFFLPSLYIKKVEVLPNILLSKVGEKPQKPLKTSKNGFKILGFHFFYKRN